MPGRPTPARDAFPAGLRDTEQQLAQINSWIRATFADTGWIEPALLSSWAYFGAPQSPPSYRLVGQTLLLRGLLNGGASGSLVFTLPEGYRPPHNVHPAGVVAAGGSIQALEVTIKTNGEVILGWASGAVEFASIDGVSIPLN
jgi:hypothetical protein